MPSTYQTLRWPAQICGRYLNKYLTHRKCVIGEDSIVTHPRMLLSHNRDKNSIRIGSHARIHGELRTFPGGQIEIGDYCHLGPYSVIWSDTKVTIGDRVLIAHNVNIIDNKTHPFDPVARHQQYVHIIQKGFPKEIDLGGKAIRIEEDAWIACSCVILRGVTIGKGAIIGAGSVVTKDIPPYALACGNPAKVIRFQEPHG
jgi:acetyltransferase-like isoleucine patch superfamily enzyme